MAAKNKIRFIVRTAKRVCNVTLWRDGLMNVVMEKELCLVCLLSAVSESTVQSNIKRLNIVIKTQQWVPCTVL